jgi:hypothetical protein
MAIAASCLAGSRRASKQFYVQQYLTNTNCEKKLGNGAVCLLYDCVILSVAVFQA